MSICIFIIFALPHYKKEIKVACNVFLNMGEEKGDGEYQKERKKISSSSGSRKHFRDTIMCNSFFWSWPQCDSTSQQRAQGLSITDMRHSTRSKEHRGPGPQAGRPFPPRGQHSPRCSSQSRVCVPSGSHAVGWTARLTKCFHQTGL